jgi:hypothetical protein
VQGHPFSGNTAFMLGNEVSSSSSRVESCAGYSSMCL